MAAIILIEIKKQIVNVLYLLFTFILQPFQRLSAENETFPMCIKIKGNFLTEVF